MVQQPMTAPLTLLVNERDHTQGPPTAPVTLVEYGDYQCPYCGEAYEIVRQIQNGARYTDSWDGPTLLAALERAAA